MEWPTDRTANHLDSVGGYREGSLRDADDREPYSASNVGTQSRTPLRVQGGSYSQQN